MPTKTKNPKQKPLIAKTQIDGKDDSAPNANPRTLEELWGFGDDKFGTTDSDEYKKKLSLMNKADLQRACIKIGVMPHDERNRMTERLMKQFNIRAAALRSADLRVKPMPTADALRQETAAWLGEVGGNRLI